MTEMTKSSGMNLTLFRAMDAALCGATYNAVENRVEDPAKEEIYWCLFATRSYSACEWTVVRVLHGTRGADPEHPALADFWWEVGERGMHTIRPPKATGSM